MSFRRAVDANPETVLLLDDSGQIAHANPVAQRTLGLAPSRSISLFDLVHWEDAPALRAAMSVCLEQPSVPIQCESRLRVDGQWRKMRCVGTNLIHDPKVRAIEMVCWDISQQAAAEQSLRRVNRALKALSRSNQALVQAQDEHELLSTVCRLIVEFAGYRFAWVGYARDDKERCVEPVAQAGFEEGYLEKAQITWNDDERGRGPTGTCIRTGRVCFVTDVLTDPSFRPWREAAVTRGFGSCVALPLTEGPLSPPFGALNIYSRERNIFDEEELDLLGELARNLAYGIVSLRARSASERARRELVEREQHLQALFEHSLDGIVTLDDTGRYLDANPAALEIYGVSREQLLQSRVGDYAAEHSSREWMQLLLERGWLTGEVCIRRADGAIRQVEFSARADFIPHRHLAVLRDVTHRTELEDQLRQAQKMEAVGRLAGGIAHDFNNLLNIIGGYAELIIDNADDGPIVRTRSEKIIAATRKAAALTSQLLAFSRKQVLTPRVIDLNDVLSDFGRMLPRLIGEHIQVRIQPAAGLDHVLSDPNQMEQVLLNLAVNARDAMPDGGELRVRTANVSIETEEASRLRLAAGRYVLLEVADTGHGMDAETQTRIFEPFFTTKDGKGTGLGLATVYGIVDQSAGRVVVESEIGKGTTFRIYLPMCSEAPVELPVVEPAAVTVRGSETLLVVEDEAPLRQAVVEYLQSNGYTVLEAPNGLRALELCGRFPGTIDLVVTDILMPHMSGHDLVAKLRSERPGIRTIYVSGFSDDVLRRSGALSGGECFLQKPFSLRDLGQQIRAMLQASEGKESTAQRPVR